MKKLIYRACFLALVGIVMVGCEKENHMTEPVEFDSDSKSKKLLNKSIYPSEIEIDWSTSDGFVQVVNNLNEGEKLLTISNDQGHLSNVVTTIPSLYNYPANNGDPGLIEICPLSAGVSCLHNIYNAHMYNLANGICDVLIIDPDLGLAVLMEEPC
jgi:hypothetical protein